MNNGWISEIFKNSRGIRQGFPLSALLFVLSVEIMALRIRNNKDIKGFQIKIDEQTHSIKISQLSDDTTLYFNSKNDIFVAMNEIEIFGNFSGLMINRNKTEGLWIGKLKHSKDKVENIKWTNKPIKTLGIYYGHDYIECEKLNWEKKIEKMNSLFLSWSKRNLSILGKVLIIKALIIPIFTFIVSSCVIPEKYKKEIESKCFKFIWNGKPDKVKRNTLIGDFEKGGLKMIDIESYFISLKASWVSRLADSKFSNWKLIPLKYLNVFGKIWLIFKMNIDVKKHKQFLNNIPEFYKNVLTSWIKTGGGQLSSPLTFSNVRKQILWGNRFITFEKKYLFFKEWINSGIFFVNDIIDNNGKITQEFILHKLKNKSNWISEFSILKKAFPKNWIDILKTESSVKSIVNIKKDYFIWNNQFINLSTLSNKLLYNKLMNVKFSNPIGTHYWINYLVLSEKPNTSSLYFFIFKFLDENKLKMFRWKLFHFIIPNKVLLSKWKIVGNSLCNFCKLDEDYSHYFITCTFLKEFWTQFQNLMKGLGIENKITLNHIVLGYKIDDKNYLALNFLITVVGFSIYKSYYISEQKTKYIDVYRIFANEYIKRINENKTLQKCSFLMKVKNYIINAK